MPASPAALYWLARNLGFGRAPALAAAVVSITFSGVGMGAEGLYRIGLYTAVFSLFPFMLTWGWAHRALDGPRVLLPGRSVAVDGTEGDSQVLLRGPLAELRRSIGVLVRAAQLAMGRWAPPAAYVAGLLLASTLVTNIIGAAGTLLILACVLTVALLLKGRTALLPATVMLVVGILASLFWTYPLLREQWLAGPNTGWVPFHLWEWVRRLARGETILPPYVAMLALLGLAGCVWLVIRRSGLRLATGVLLLSVPLILLVSSDALVPAGSPLEHTTGLLRLPIRVLRDALHVRAAMFLWVLLPLLVAAGIQAATEILRSVPGVRRALAVLPWIVVAVLAVHSYPHLDRATDGIRTTGSPSLSGAWVQMDGAFVWLRENAPAHSVVLTLIDEAKWGELGTYSVDSIVNQETRMRSVNGQQIEAAQISFALIDAFRRPERSDLEEGPLLHLFNVSYVLTYGTPPYRSSFLAPRYRAREVAVYETRSLPGGYELLAEDVDERHHELELRLEKAQLVQVPVQYNDHWRALVDGAPAEMGRGKDGLVALQLPAGTHTVLLRYGPYFQELVAMGVSGMTVAVVLLHLIGEWRVRRRRDITGESK